MREFKTGDKVYYPFRSTKVLTIHERNSPDYPMLVSEHTSSFTIDGKSYIEDILPSIFHATPENHTLLEQLYGVEFEAPPVKPTSREIVQAMLKMGEKYVCCWVSDFEETPTSENEWAYISEYVDDSYPFTMPSDSGWKYATPFDPHTGEAITGLPT